MAQSSFEHGRRHPARGEPRTRAEGVLSTGGHPDGASRGAGPKLDSGRRTYGSETEP
jgi:hypothetical protein